MPRLRQQEKTDLRHVRAGRDVNKIVLRVGIEGVGAREVVEAAVDFLEVDGSTISWGRSRTVVSGEMRRMSSCSVWASNASRFG